MFVFKRRRKAAFLFAKVIVWPPIARAVIVGSRSACGH
jgi:hypothetical protein